MTALTAGERLLLGDVADILIPCGSDMPSGSQAEVATRYIDSVFSVRPDLVDTVRAGLAELPEELPETFEALAELALPMLRPLADAVTAAYFLNPEVARQVGYRTRSVIPIRFDDDLDELVSAVVARGPLYRPTPHTEEH